MQHILEKLMCVQNEDDVKFVKQVKIELHNKNTQE